MAKVKYSEFSAALDAAAALDGTETVVVIQDGVPVESTTQDIADLGGGSIDKTVAEMQALALASGFTAGQLYKITDAGDLGLFFRAATTSKLENDGIRVMLCPAYYGTGENAGDGNNWLGVWNADLTPAADDLAIWGGLVWRNLTGAVGSFDSDIALDGTNWQVVAKASFTASEYTPLMFGCSYDLTNNWISRQWDGKGNVFGLDYFVEQDSFGFGFNLCDVSDWNHATSLNYFYGNKCLGVWNNSAAQDIYENALPNGYIRQNNGGGAIYQNSNTGTIEDNTNTGGIYQNANAGNIVGNTNNGDIYQNANAGYIGNNSNTNSIYGNLNSGNIGNNSNQGPIYKNSNTGDIINNSNSAEIYLNVNAGAISGNSNTALIASNSNTGVISNNSNEGQINACYGVGDIDSQTGGGLFGELPKAVSAQSNNTSLGASANGVTFTDAGSAGTVRFDFEDVHPTGTEFSFFVTDNGIELNPGAVSQTIQFWDGSVSRNTPLVLLGAPGKSITIRKISATVWAGIAVNGAIDND